MTRASDLTEGRIWQQLVKFAVPLVISSFLQSMYSIADMIIAGRFIGPDGLSAINNAGMILQMLNMVIMGITTGGNILIGQRFGAKDTEGCRRAVNSLFTVSLIIGAVMSALLFLLSRVFLMAINAPALEDAVAYMRICSVGLFFVICYNALGAALRAVGNSHAPLACIVVTASLNVVLDIVFVGMLGMGTQGAALATVISQCVSAVVLLIFVLRGYEVFGLALRRLYVHRESLKTILQLGIPCAAQMSVAGVSWLSVTFLINSYGVHVSAGSGVSMRIRDFCQLFISAMANGAAGMIAQNIGAQKFDRAREVLYTTMKITVAMSAVLIVIVELSAPGLVSLFTDDPGTAAAAVSNLRIEIIGQIFYAVFMVYHSLALGAGHTWFVLASSTVNCIFVRLVLAFTLNRFFGLTGLYAACMIAPASSVPLGLWYERSNKWRHALKPS